MLRRRLVLSAAAIALVLSFVLTGLEIWRGNAIVSIMSKQLIEQMTKAVRHEVSNMITFGNSMSVRMVNDIARHDVPFNDPVALRRELYGFVIDEPNVRWLACGNDTGGMTDAGRLADGTIVFLMTDGFHAGVYREYEASPDGQLGNLRKSGVYFDTRKQPWYTKVRETRARYWTKAYLGSVERLLGVGLSAPVLNKDGSFAGVCNVKLIFTALSDWMNSLRLGDNGRAFVIDGNGQLIAASGKVSPVAIGADGKHLRLLASEAADPLVQQTARQLSRYPNIAGTSSAAPRVFSFDVAERGRIYAAVDRFEGPDEIKWTIIAAVPASDFLGPVYRAAYLSVAAGTVVALTFALLGPWIVGRTLRPLTALTLAAQAISKGEWRDVPKVQRNDEVGLLTHAFAVMTARLKESLDGLRRSEANLEEAQRVAHVGHWERDLDTQRVTWSDETYRIWGLTPGERAITRAEILEGVHPEDRQIWIRTAEEAEHGDSRYDLEYRVVRPNGEVRIVHSLGDLRRDASGRPRSLFGTIQDITERKQAEYLIGQVFESSPDGISVIGRDYRYRRVNPVYERNWRMPAEKIVGKHVADLLGAEAFEQTIKPYLDRCFEGEDVSHAQWFITSLGRRYLAVTYSPLRPHFERVEAALAITRDLTDHMLASEALRGAQAELAHANRVATMGQLTASIAHEVNQPIAAVVTDAQAALRWLAVQPPDLAETRQALGRIVKSGNRGSEVIGRIRALIKKAPARKDRVAVNDAVLEVIALIRAEATQNSVSVQIQLGEGLPLIQVDRVQLQQVVLNLIINAIEAMRCVDEGSRELVISTGKTDSGGVLVAVQDSGPGLAAATLARLFEPFYTTKPNGLGLGLSICHSIVEAHGGKLWVAANAPRGAIFQFTLPVDPA